MSAHLQARLPSGGALVARYSPTEVLRQTVPWWLARKYDVRLVDSFGGVIASTAEGRDLPTLPERQTHRTSLEPTLADAYLERNIAGQAPRGGYEARWRHRGGRLLDGCATRCCS
jgi:two-component system, LuxR family, sensor histidine kinase DctS